MAVAEGVFVVGHKSGIRDAAEIRDALVTAKLDEVPAERDDEAKPRFAASSATFRAVMGHTGEGYFAGGHIHDPWNKDLYESGQMRGAVGNGVTLSIDGDRIRRELRYRFAQDASHDQSKVETFASKYYNLDELSVTKEGDRLYSVSGLVVVE
jgi:hypothetical protein